MKAHTARRLYAATLTVEPRVDRRVVDDRRFAIKNRDGEFVQKFIGTQWETVKREIVWTENKVDAASWSMSELLSSGSGYMDVVCGFPGTSLVQVK